MQLTREQAINLVVELQQAVLVGLGRRAPWNEKDMSFHGGTSLKLAWNSHRFSEDLDFLVSNQMITPEHVEKVLHDIVDEIQVQGVSAFTHSTPFSLALRNKSRPDNPNKAFWIVWSHPEVRGNVKLKVEFYMAEPEPVHAYGSDMQTLAYRNSMNVDVKADLNIAALKSIYIDKLSVLAYRQMIKYRDVYDLWFVVNEGAIPEQQELVAGLKVNNLLYERTFPQRFEKTTLLLETRPFSLEDYEIDMQNWLPEDIYASMKESGKFEEGINLVYAHQEQYLELLEAIISGQELDAQSGINPQ